MTRGTTTVFTRDYRLVYPSGMSELDVGFNERVVEGKDTTYDLPLSSVFMFHFTVKVFKSYLS